MQKEIDLVAVLCNKIAQHLVVEEYADNQKSIREQGLLVHGIRKRPEEGGGKEGKKSASQIALEMCSLAMKISDDYATRSKLAYDCKLDYHLREGKANLPEVFPFPELQAIDPTTEEGKNELKSILLHYNTTNPAEVKTARLKMGISQSQWKEWLISADKSYKQSVLKQKVLENSETGILSLPGFKKLARQAYPSKYFNPSDPWCKWFITRQQLEDRVDIRSL